MTIARRLIAALFALLIAVPVFAQAQRSYSQAELDQMLAPIALYPDPLLSQVLMAAAYPHEVAEAARWSRAYPDLQGDEAVRAAQNDDWDPSVQSLVAFPQILARMDENLDWTRRLGEAFLAQEPHVMDTVQQLRRRAQAAGNLQSSEQMYVQQQSQAILVQPASPQYVYVPYYDPMVVYGPWWWPAYRPMVWAPWPGYARPYRQVGFWWGRPVGLSLNFFFGNFDWGYRQVRVVQPNAYYYRAAALANRTLVATPQRWQNEARRREVVIQRQPVQVPQSVQAQPQVLRQERRAAVSAERQERRVEQQPSRPQVNALPSVQLQPAIQAPASVQVQPQVRPQPQARTQPEARPRPIVRQEQRARMPVSIAPQQPRAERQEQRKERRELHQEPRNERVQKGGQRS